MEIGYCVKCKSKREMKNASKEKINGRNVIKGECSKCGTKMFKFV